MRQIVSEFGKVFLSVVVIVFLMIQLFGSQHLNLLNEIGKSSNYLMKQSNRETENETLKSIIKKPKIKLYYNDNFFVRSNTNIFLLDIIQITDGVNFYTGKEIVENQKNFEIVIDRITDQNLNVVNTTDKYNVLFDTPGIYTLNIKVKTNDNQIQHFEIFFPVDIKGDRT